MQDILTRCQDAILAGQERAREERATALERLALDGMLGVEAIAAKVGRSPSQVSEHVRLGWTMPTTPTGLIGRPPMLWPEQGAATYARFLASHPDGRMQRFVGAPGRRGRIAAEEVTAAVMPKASYATVRQRVADRRSLRQGISKGRPRSTDQHTEWLEAFDELLDYYERLVCSGELLNVPGPWAICGELADERFNASQAAIYKAVKALHAPTY